MTIDEAIKELQKDVPPIPFDEYSLNTQAKALGTEALKRWKQRHEHCPDDINFLLPEETKE